MGPHEKQGEKKTLQLSVGYKIPKKIDVSTDRTTPATLEEVEVVSRDDERNQHTIASKICKPKGVRTESSSAELLRAIELMEVAERFERQAKHKREEARQIIP